ncbi:hypothetical protein TNCT_566991 [Trichonephila clavata]|uniref:Uncharacterized protein n=1 Tax=Trichonephila clavata TaxID=2740835 RepID=A0A8X6KSP8_TRICU|nr:hypothetical protein TNCT_566991 [Trichonephila clavata]
MLHFLRYAASDEVHFPNAKSAIPTFKNKKESSNKNCQKYWWNTIQNISIRPRMKTVAEFCLARNLYLIKVLTVPCCMLCNLPEPMDCTHLMHCPTLCSESAGTLLES